MDLLCIRYTVFRRLGRPISTLRPFERPSLEMLIFALPFQVVKEPIPLVIRHTTMIFLVGWSSWGACGQKCTIGTKTRTRYVTTAPAYGGAGCPHLRESSPCGQANGGCADVCSGNGKCSCTRAGYELQGNPTSDQHFYCFVYQNLHCMLFSYQESVVEITKRFSKIPNTLVVFCCSGFSTRKEFGC